MWLARDIDGELYLYSSKPVKSLELGIWNVDVGIVCEMIDIFSEVKWEDDEPTEVKIVIKNNRLKK